MLRDNARKLRKRMTEVEQALWKLLRRKQLEGHRFRKQVPIGKYIVDFACLDARLIIEVDGGQHSEAAGADSERDAWLRSQNFRVLRFWNNDVLKNPEGVMQVVVEALEAKT
jgi:very-short-patch-repair endonuclease